MCIIIVGQPGCDDAKCKSMVGFYFKMLGKKNFIMRKRYRKVQKLVIFAAEQIAKVIAKSLLDHQNLIIKTRWLNVSLSDKTKRPELVLRVLNRTRTFRKLLKRFIRIISNFLNATLVFRDKIRMCEIPKCRFREIHMPYDKKCYLEFILNLYTAQRLPFSSHGV